MHGIVFRACYAGVESDVLYIAFSQLALRFATSP